MSTTIDETTPDPTPAPVTDEQPAVVVPLVKLIKAPIVLGVFTMALALLVGFKGRSGDTTFRLATDTDLWELPTITVPSTPTVAVLVILLTLCTVGSLAYVSRGRSTPLWLIALFALFAMTAFLAWAAAGADGEVPVVSLFAGAIALAVPLVFGALGGVIGERAGVVNIAIDGQLLFGAFAGAVVGSISGSPWIGLIGSMAAGALVALILAVFAISYYVDQVIVGVVLNVLIIGVTNFMFSELLKPHTEALNSPPRFERWEIPILSDIPLLGPILFRQTAIVYVLFIVVAVVTWALYRSRWGLRLRAVGEHPKAADTVGINVARTRYRAVLIAGAIAGMGGAFYVFVSVPQFNQELTGGAGFIALAAVIFGRWDPIRATLAALLFGFASNLQGVLSVLGSPVPSEFMLMLPYVVTIVAVAGLVGASRAPAADGVPYRKG